MFINRRTMIIIGIVVVVVMLGAGIGLVYAFSALSQQNTTNANLSATVTAVTAASSPSSGTKSGQRRVTGVIQSLGSSSFVLSANQGKRKITVNIDAQTMFRRAGKAASFRDLQVGETVVVLGTLDTSTKTMRATRVMISPTVATPTPTATP